MNTISFPVYKFEGTGNDFIIVDEWEHQVIPEEYKGLISKKLCERRGSIGADGVLFWSKSKVSDGQYSELLLDTEQNGSLSRVNHSVF